jgi:hypothetical protein
MRPCPATVGGARVVCYTPIDSRHVKTGNTTHIVASEEAESPKGLAICQYEGDNAYYLFGCNEAWQSYTDTWHESLEDAKEQAEFEYTGTSTTWITLQ